MWCGKRQSPDHRTLTLTDVALVSRHAQPIPASISPGTITEHESLPGGGYVPFRMVGATIAAAWLKIPSLL